MPLSHDLSAAVLAVERGLLTPAQLVAALVDVRRSGRPVAAAVLGRGWVDPARWAAVSAEVVPTSPYNPPAVDAVLAALDSIAADGEGVGPPSAADRYERRELVGVGGCGSVRRAWDAHLGRHVAAKEPRADRAGAASLLAAEAAVLARLRHPNVVPLYDLVTGGDGRALFYTMPLLTGPTLREAAGQFHAARPAGPARLALLPLVTGFVQVCRAVAHAHARGVLHLDLKGDNVKYGAEGGEAVVIDWGLGRPHGGPGSGPAGTPGYCAPEQAAGRPPDVRTDVYGLGAVLHELLTGRPPGAAPFGTAPPGVPRALESVCRKALAARPADRYPSADELRADVERWLADEPVMARREPAAERAGRWARRHGRAVRAGAAGLLLAVAALGFGLARADRARADADRARSAAVAALAAEQEGLRLAVRAAGECFEAVADPRLAGEPGLHPVRLRLAERGLEHYQAVLARHADDPGVRLEVGGAWLRTGYLRREVGHQEEAGRAFAAAVAVLEADPPAGQRHLLPEARAALAGCLGRAGRRAEAGGQLDRAEAECSGLPADDPAALHVRIYVHDARALAAAGPAAAEAEFLAVAAAAGRAAAADPGHANGYRHWRGLARLQAAIRQHALGRPADARATLAAALAEFEALAAAGSWPVVTRRRVVACLNFEGVLDLDAGDVPAAVERLGRAVALRRELLAPDPASRDARAELATSLSHLGRALRLAGRPADALAPAREAAGLADGVHRDAPADPSARFLAGRARARLGQAEAAAGDWDRAECDLRAARGLLAPLAAGSDPTDCRQAAEAADWLARARLRRGAWPEAFALWAEAAAHLARVSRPATGG